MTGEYFSRIHGRIPDSVQQVFVKEKNGECCSCACLSQTQGSIQLLSGKDGNRHFSVTEDRKNERIYAARLCGRGKLVSVSITYWVALTMCLAQAIDRTHRIGQTREVRAIRFVVEESIEERILQVRPP